MAADLDKSQFCAPDRTPAGKQKSVGIYGIEICERKSQSKAAH
jgi:hypothetical protein